MRSHVAVLVCAGSIVGCAELPGKEVGSWAVTATMDETTCGPSIGQQERTFEAAIRKDGEVGWWIGPGQVPIEGRIDDEGNFTFRTNEQILVREGDTATGIAPCVMDQVDIAEGRAAGSLEATEEMWIGTSSGADCSDQIGLMPGQFSELPCQMTFTLVGEAPVSEEPTP